MIEIVDKKACCGCSACVQRCPKHCISMKEDEQGFLYPEVDKTACIDCGLCEKVCPVINQVQRRLPIKVYASRNADDEVRKNSSSGGVFTVLAEKIIEEGGVVFGAKFNNDWDVIHSKAETREGLVDFRGSKYVQSQIGTTYRDAEAYLKQGRKVLFSGTPCQIAGLKQFLRKDYDNLFTVDIICHGVPSPLVWREYLQKIMRPEGADGRNTVLKSSKGVPVITGINFRDKSTGWKKYGFVVRVKSAVKADQNSVLLSDKHEQEYIHERFLDNVFIKGFLKDIYLRPSCYDCPSKCLKSGADISLGDFWGIQRYLPDFDDDKGVSLVMINSIKGAEYFNSPKLLNIETSYEQALSGNSAIERSVKLPIKVQEQFWSSDDKIAIIPELCNQLRPNVVRRCINLTKRIIKKILRK